MDTKISHDFWDDDVIDSAPPPIKLAALWLLTNSSLNIAGWMPRPGSKRFANQTGLRPQVLEEALEALKHMFIPAGNGVWVRNYIRRNIGGGPNLAKNKLALSAVRQIEALDEPELIKIVTLEYPQLAELFISEKNPHALPIPLVSPSHPHPHPLPMSLASPSYGDGMDQSRVEKSRVEKSREEIPERAGAREPASDPPGAVEQSWRRICAMFGREGTRAPAYDAAHQLADLHPIGEDEFRLMEWFRKQPAHDAVIELKSRSRSAESLVADWEKQLDYARGYRTQHGPKIVAKKTEPVGWQDAAARLNGGAPVASSFWSYPAATRNEILAAMEPQEAAQ